MHLVFYPQYVPFFSKNWSYRASEQELCGVVMVEAVCAVTFQLRIVSVRTAWVYMGQANGIPAVVCGLDPAKTAQNSFFHFELKTLLTDLQ